MSEEKEQDRRIKIGKDTYIVPGMPLPPEKRRAIKDQCDRMWKRIKEEGITGLRPLFPEKEDKDA